VRSSTGRRAPAPITWRWKERAAQRHRDARSRCADAPSPTNGRGTALRIDVSAEHLGRGPGNAKGPAGRMSGEASVSAADGMTIPEQRPPRPRRTEYDAADAGRTCPAGSRCRREGSRGTCVSRSHDRSGGRITAFRPVSTVILAGVIGRHPGGLQVFRAPQHCPIRSRHRSLQHLRGSWRPWWAGHGDRRAPPPDARRSDRLHDDWPRAARDPARFGRVFESHRASLFCAG